MDGANADVGRQKPSLQANDGQTLNVEDSGHCSFEWESSDADGYEDKDGDDADVEEEEDAS
jgi:hypothetical protein